MQEEVCSSAVVPTLRSHDLGRSLQGLGTGNQRRSRRPAPTSALRTCGALPLVAEFAERRRKGRDIGDLQRHQCKKKENGATCCHC